MKLLTSASICRRALGRAFRTRVVCDSPRRGQVTLVGDGDPHLSTADVRRLAVRLAEQGVTAVEGPLRVVDPLRDDNATILGSKMTLDGDRIAHLQTIR